MSRSLVPSSSRTSFLSRPAQRQLPQTTRQRRHFTKFARERPIDWGIHQTRARPKGRGMNSGNKPEDDETEEKSEVEPDVEVTPTEAEAKEITSPKASSSVPKEKPAAKNEAPSSATEVDNIEDEETVAPWKEDRPTDIRNLKSSLLSTVAGYDRGFAAVAKDTANIRQIVESLETLSGSIDLTADIKTEPSSQQLFDGTWKLIFSSAFNAGSRRVRPAPPLFSVGPVYQVIDTQKRELDNVLELLLVNSPRLPWAPSNAVPKIRVVLKHEMNFSMSIVSVALKETTLRILETGFDIPSLTLPSLAAFVRSLTRRTKDGEFSLVYLDEDMRITEGDRSELRIFVKVPDLE